MSDSAIFREWNTSTAYLQDEAIYTSTDPEISIQYHRKMFRCITPHTSFSFTTDFGNGYWEEMTVRGIKGDQGDVGSKGDIGPQGLQGIQGFAGANGADGIFSTIASTAEAEAGVDDTKGMTPLKTKNSFDANIITYDSSLKTDTINPISARLSLAEANIAALRNTTDIVNLSGIQYLENNVLVATDIIGKDFGPNGGGDKLALNSVGAKSARIRAEIYRKDDTEERFTVANLELHFMEGSSTWAIGRTSTTILVGGDDGVTFDVTTSNPSVGIYIAQVNYISDNMVGGNYSASSYIKFLLEEISNF